MADLLEGWSYPVSETVYGLNILDHTFVKAPSNGPAYFNCFGGHAAPQAHPLEGASGNGNYAVANCYRQPSVLPDTAGLAPYGTHGVCHQAANRFLWSACGLFSGATVHNAQAYGLSFSFYGTYGRPLAAPPPPSPWPPIPEPPPDFVAIYGACWAKAKLVGETLWYEKPAPASPQGFEQRIVALHAGIHSKREKVDPNAVLDEELRLLIEERLGPKFELAKIREVRNRALARAHSVATSDLRGRAFADAINGIAVQYQDELEEHLGSENHSQLLSVGPKERYALVDPELAEREVSRGSHAA